MKDSIKREQRQVVLHFAERENSRATLKKKIFLLFALLCAVVQGAWAESYVEQTVNYEVTVTGPKTLRIKVPVYDEDGSDHWVYNGNLKVTWTDGNNTQQTKTILHWGSAIATTTQALPCPSLSRQRWVAASTSPKATRRTTSR